MSERVRIVIELADLERRSSIAGVEDVFCPTLKGLPGKHLATLASLPIHDFNGVLIDAIECAPYWPKRVWACVFPSDPFRAAAQFVRQLRRLGVERICFFPVMNIEAYGASMEAEAALGSEAALAGLMTGSLHPDLSRISPITPP